MGMSRRGRRRSSLGMTLALLCALGAGWVGFGPRVADAAVAEVTIPLRDGHLDTDYLAGELRAQLGLKEFDWLHGQVDLRGLRGNLFLKALNASLGEGCRVAMNEQQTELLLRIDTEKLPQDLDQTKSAVRTFTAVASPEATAAQNKFYGLLVPHDLSDHADEPLVVLVHGLDCNRSNWVPMAEMLQGEGFRVAFFTYPSDQPLADSANLLAVQMAALRQAFPEMPVHLVAHSMGSLVARAFVEGPEYEAVGGVKSLILLAPPNHGSKWASFRFALEVEEHYRLWRDEPTWHPTWMITDGLGEAGKDLKVGSAFLQSLNDRPRRAGVRYTIVMGNQHPAARMTAGCVEAAGKVVPRKLRDVWGFRHYHRAMENTADELREDEANSDGPVSVKSARLEGVDDFVLVHADHTSLYIPLDEKHVPPGWAVVADRIRR